MSDIDLLRPRTSAIDQIAPADGLLQLTTAGAIELKPVTGIGVQVLNAADDRKMRELSGFTGSDRRYLQGFYANIPGDAPSGGGDVGMIGGLYDRNELTLAGVRGSIVGSTLSGPGVIFSNLARITDANGDAVVIGTGIDATSQIRLVFDLGALQPNYSAVRWQPFINFRFNLQTTGAVTSYPQAISCEVSADNILWYAAPGWSTTNAAAESPAPGIWAGALSSLPTISQWRYCRFTLSSFVLGSVLPNSLYIAEIGLRHPSAPAARQFLRADGGTVFGNLFIGSGASRVWLDTNAGIKVGNGAFLSAMNRATKNTTAQIATDTVTVVGALIGDLVLISRGSGGFVDGFVSAANTITFSSVGIPIGTTIIAVALRFS